ncbi:FG-GAP repeat domain-containing protein [Bacteroidota bacterium]
MKNLRTHLIVFCILLVFSKVPVAQDLFTEHVVFNNFSNAVSIAGGDLDNDGDIDMVATSFDGNYVAWMENDGMQNFTKHIIIENLRDAHVLDVAHINDDNYYDIVCAAKADDLILWFKNDGLGNFTADTVVANWETASFVMAKDHFKNMDLIP